MTSSTSTGTGNAAGGGTSSGVTDIREFGHELWSYLTGKGATVEYAFDDMIIEVPKTTGPDPQRAAWRLHGTLRVRTSDNDAAGSIAPDSRGDHHTR